MCTFNCSPMTEASPLNRIEGTVVACVKKHGLQVSEVSALFFSSM